MREVRKEIVSQNEHVMPLDGCPEYRNSGVIYALDAQENKYAVAQIDFERFDEQHFQYVFTPQWSVIDALPPEIFQGIPGLDMSLRQEKYYRVNMTPSFITMRTPSESREDLWELLESVGMDYYDRFEWLLRTNMPSGMDNLIVEKLSAPREINISENEDLPDNLTPQDSVLVSSLEGIAQTISQWEHRILKILRSGAKLILAHENRAVSAVERYAMLATMMAQTAIKRSTNQSARAKGIAKAKSGGKYKGRKRICVDEKVLHETARLYRLKQINKTEAKRRMGIASDSTFFRRLRNIEE